MVSDGQLVQDTLDNSSRQVAVVEPELLERVLLHDKLNRHGAVLPTQFIREEARVEVEV